MRHCTLVLEHSKRHQFQAFGRGELPLALHASATVSTLYNISVNSNQILATLLSVMYLALAFDASLRLDHIPSWYKNESTHT